MSGNIMLVRAVLNEMYVIGFINWNDHKDTFGDQYISKEDFVKSLNENFIKSENIVGYCVRAVTEKEMAENLFGEFGIGYEV